MMKIVLTGLALVGAVAVVLVSERGAAAVAGAQVGKLAKEIDESSGVVASRRHEGVFWTHNDANNAPRLFAITREGKLLKEYRVDAKNADWEDIAIDDEGRLYIANTGNNEGQRSVVEVLRVEEPDPGKGGGKKLKVERRWQLQYPGEAQDCESLFVYQGKGYLITKVSRGRGVVYRFGLEAGEEPVTLEAVATLPVHWPVTGADLEADGKRLAVVSTKGLHVFRIDGDVAKAGTAAGVFVDFGPQKDVEGCCFVPGGGVLATAEGREVYFFGEELLGR